MKVVCVYFDENIIIDTAKLHRVDHQAPEFKLGFADFWLAFGGHTHQKHPKHHRAIKAYAAGYAAAAACHDAYWRARE